MPIQTITTTRTTLPNGPKLVADLRAAIDATVGVAAFTVPGDVRLKKNTAWTAPQIASAQSIIDNAPADTLQLQAQQKIDSMDIFDKSRDLLILDQFNLMRQKLRGLGVTGIPDLTIAQYIQAMKDKAGTL